MRKVTFIDPNDAEVTYGILSSCDKSGLILISEAARDRAFVDVAEGRRSLWDASVFAGAGARAFSAMVAQNPVTH